MRVLLAVHHFPPHYNAGAELYTLRLARWLRARGHEAEVVCVEELDYARPAALAASDDVFDGVPVTRLSLGMAGAAFSWSYDHPLINAWLRERLQRSRPDLLHLHSGYLLGGGVLREAHAAGVPSVVTLHDFWFICPRTTLLRGDGKVCAEVPSAATCAWCLKLSRRRYRLADRLSGGHAGQAWQRLLGHEAAEGINDRRAHLREALERARLVVAPTHFLAGHFADDVDPGRLRVMRLGIDTKHLKQLAPPEQEGPLRLGYIGQIASHKGLDILIRAFSALPLGGRPVTLSVHGDLTRNPRYAATLARLAAADPRITLAGRFENSAVGSVLEQTDALVVPSIWYENSPLAILEAHAARRPVLVSAMGGMAELVRDEVDGLHFRPGDAADLARQIQRLRVEPGLLNRLHAGIGAVVDTDEELDALFAAYQEIVAHQSPALPLEVA